MPWRALTLFERTIITIMIAAFVYGLSVGLNVICIPLLFHAHGLSKTWIGILHALDLGGILCTGPFLSRWIARYGVKRVVACAGIVRNTALFCLPLCPSLPYWLLCMLLFGIGGGTMFTAIQFWVNSICSSKNRATLLGSLGAAFAVGITTVPLIIPYTGNKGLLPFLTSALLCTSTLVPLCLGPKALPQQIQIARIDIRSVLKNTPLPVLGGMVTDFTYFSFSTFLVLYGLEYGLSEEKASYLLASMLIGSILFEVPVGWISDRMNRVVMIVSCAVLFCFLAQGLDYAMQHTPLPHIILALICGALGGIYTSSLGMLGDHFHSKDLAAANATYAMMNSVGAMLGVFCTGRAMDYWGKEGLTTSVTIGMVCFLLVIMLLRRLHQRYVR